MAAFTSAYPAASFQVLTFVSQAREHRGISEVRPLCILVHRRKLFIALPGECSASAIQDAVISSGSRFLHPSVKKHGRTGCNNRRRKQVVPASFSHNDPVTANGTDTLTSSSNSAEHFTSKDENPAELSVGLDQDKALDEQNGRLQVGYPTVADVRVSGAEEEINRPKKIYFDYGFQASFLRTGPSVPRNAIKLAIENFGREWRALRRSYLFNELTDINPTDFKNNGGLGVFGAYFGRAAVLLFRGVDKLLQLYDGLPELNPEIQDLTPEQAQLRDTLKKLTLSNDNVWERERNRPPVEAPWWILGPYYILCTMLDVIFNNRPVQRFWFLETVARMPYFSYISMLHLYETLGWWRVGAEVRKVHFAEEWNEMHHLKIMEALGGDLLWGDRFFAQHAAFFYYWVLNTMFLISPKVAYNFSELIESHAVDTYGEFLDENEVLLKTLPPPPVAIQYYEAEDLYMYDEFQTSQVPEARRPKIDSLYDVFAAICGDEGEHVKTMVACQRLDTVVTSPHRPRSK